MPHNARAVMEKWSRNLSSAGQSMKDGIANVDTSPGVLAAESIDNYRAGVLRALDSGKTEAAMRNVDLAMWKERASSVGVERAVQAASSEVAKQHTLQFLEAFLPFAQGVKEQIRRMPKGTLEAGKARAVRAIELMSEFSFTRR